MVCFWIPCLCAFYNKTCLKSLKGEAEYRIEMILYSILTSSFVQFFLSFFLLLTYDAVMLAKKKNVKSCIIYEICIKEICNSIINKILIQFLEPVVLMWFLLIPIRVKTQWLMDKLQEYTRSRFSRSWLPNLTLLGLQFFLCRTSYEIDPRWCNIYKKQRVLTTACLNFILV